MSEHMLVSLVDLFIQLKLNYPAREFSFVMNSQGQLVLCSPGQIGMTFETGDLFMSVSEITEKACKHFSP